MEIWKDINGFDGAYQISNFGNIKSSNRIDRFGRAILGIQKKPCRSGDYLACKMKHNSVAYSKYIHILVAEHFLDYKNINNYDVDHIDGNRLNNHVSNLQYLSHRDNVQKSKKSNTGIKNISKSTKNGHDFYSVNYYYNKKPNYLGGSTNLEKAKKILQDFKTTNNIQE